MCLAIPAEVIKLNHPHAQVDIMGTRKDVNILLVGDLCPGDKVLVHAGFAINKIDNEYYDLLNKTVHEMLDHYL